MAKVATPLTPAVAGQLLRDDKGNYLVNRSASEREIYVDGIWGMMAHGATIKVNFFTRALNTDGYATIDGERRELAVRMVLTTPNFISIAKFFAEQAKRIEEQSSLPEEVKDLMKKMGLAHIGEEAQTPSTAEAKPKGKTGRAKKAK